jgi:hypothetical protein
VITRDGLRFQKAVEDPFIIGLANCIGRIQRATVLPVTMIREY